MIDLKNINPKLLFLALFFLNIIAYHNAFHNDCRYDQSVVYNGARIESRLDRVKYAFHLDSPDAPVFKQKLTWFRPVPFLISWELMRFAKGQAYMINLVNILIITVTAFILYQFLCFLFGRHWLSLIAAVIFCLHPVNGVWINDYQGGVHILLFLGLMLLSTHAFLLYVTDRKGIGIYLASLVLFVLSLLFHEIAVFLPIYMVLTMHVLKLKNYPRAYGLLVPYGILTGIYLVVRHAVLGRDVFVHEGAGHLAINFISYGATLIKAFVLYLGKLVTAQGIAISWSEPFVTQGFLIWIVLGGVLLALFIRLFFYQRNIPGWALMMLMAGFVPNVIGGLLLPKQGFIYEANWIFFTTIGYCVLVAWVLESLIAKFRRAGTVVLVCLTAFLLNMGWFYNALYADEVGYAQHYHKYAPGFRMANIFLYDAYYKNKRYDDARQILRQTMKNDKSDADLYYYLSLIDIEQGDYAEAEKHVVASLTLDPGLAEGFTVLGKVFEHRGDHEKAALAYKKAAQ